MMCCAVPNALAQPHTFSPTQEAYQNACGKYYIFAICIQNLSNITPFIMSSR